MQCGEKLTRKLPQGNEEESLKEEEIESVNPSIMMLTLEAMKSVLGESPLTGSPSSAVYAKRPLSPLRRYLLTALVLSVAGLFLGYGGTWLSYLGFTIAGFVAPILYLVWMARNDRFEREPFALVAITFGWGLFCGIIASILNLLVAIPLIGSPGAAFVEEPLKLLGVYWLATNSRIGSEFNDHLDGMVYGAAAGAGFAGLENFYYSVEMVVGRGLPPLGAIALRSAISFCHIAWSAIAGRSIGLAKVLRGRNEFYDMIPGLVIVIPVHFLWNASPPLLSLFVLLPFIVFILVRQVRAAQRDEVRWGFMKSAPVE